MRKKIREFEDVIYYYLSCIHDMVINTSERYSITDSGGETLDGNNYSLIESVNEILEGIKSKCPPSIYEHTGIDHSLERYFHDLFDEIEDYILHLDSDARKVFLTNCVRSLYLKTYSDIQEVDNTNGIIKTLNGDHQELIRLIGDYFSTIKMYIIDFGLENSLDIPEDRCNILMSLPDPNYINGELKNTDGRKEYETMPIMHRRAAVMALINKSGLCKNIDRTKKAKFTEAVVGGNIKARPQDSASNKAPTTQAQKGAFVLLSEIGIN